LNAAAQHPVLLVAVPLTFAALCPMWALWKREACFPWALGGLTATTFLAWSLIGKVSASKAITYNLSRWKPPWGIQIRIDYIGLLMICIITGIGLLVLVYSYRYVNHELKPERIPYYYTLFLLIMTAMLGFSITGDLFNMFVFMEIFSITSYALVAISGEKSAVRAAVKYLFMGAASSLTFLLAIAFLYSAVGSLNMLDISNRLKTTPYVQAAAVALLLMVVAFSVKAALFPVHVWLPDAHSMAPSPISAILSALVIKMGVIGLFRTLFTIYGPSFASRSGTWSSLAEALSWLAVLSIIVGATMAIIQKDLKIMIAYSSVVHIGYIVLGLMVLSRYGMTGGLFDILAHAMAKSCFFLVAGIFIFKDGRRRIDQLRGLGRTMPVSAAAISVAALSILGIPPTAGFMAKFYILWGCLQRAKYHFVVLALVGTLLTAVYCLRIIYYLYFTGSRRPDASINEAPVSMYVPAAVLACGVIFFGIFSALVIPPLNNAARIILAK
jgi:multicomponent Na+:H+ antiporter subunit D